MQPAPAERPSERPAADSANRLVLRGGLTIAEMRVTPALR
jgi:hypothetical protein